MQKISSTQFPGDCYRYEPGEIILKEGQGSNFIYILISGVLGVLKGETQVSEITSRGTIFGEMSSILGKPRTCTVTALTDSQVAVYHGGIDGIMRKFPSITLKILKTLAERLVTLDDNYSEIIRRCDDLQNELEQTKEQLEKNMGEKGEFSRVSEHLNRAGSDINEIRQLEKKAGDHFHTQISDEDLKDISEKGLFKKGWKSKDLDW